MVRSTVSLRGRDISQSGWKLGIVSVEKVMAERKKREMSSTFVKKRRERRYAKMQRSKALFIEGTGNGSNIEAMLFAFNIVAVTGEIFYQISTFRPALTLSAG